MAAIVYIGLKSTNNKVLNHRIWIATQGFDPKKHRLILCVNNSFIDDLKEYFIKNIYLAEPKPKPVFGGSALIYNSFQNQIPDPGRSVSIYALLYDFQRDIVIDCKRQEYEYSDLFKTFIAELGITNVLKEKFNRYFHKTRTVASVEGPFKEVECKTLETEVKIGTKYYFRATPKQYVSPTEMLLIKWQYRYDDDDPKSFNSSYETGTFFNNVMSCTFDKNPQTIKVYAFFRGLNEKVAVKFDIFNTSGESENAGEDEMSEDENVCKCEERIRAFMRMLRIGEGTENEKGYTTQYSGKQFTDMSKHPENVIKAGNYSSSAAGAYQIMRYTWWWLKGEKLTDKNLKANVYEKSHDYIKKYSIPDFSAESQDKLCIIILKHKRQGSLELITEGKIKEALEKYGSYEWASLPPGRYGQPAQTMDEALKKYQEFLNDELKGKTNLHLKKGFLKEFNIVCNCKTAPVNKGYNIDAAVAYIESHAEEKSINACAKYVRVAIEAGGLKSNASPRNALNYFTILKDLGFTELQTTDYKKGDIVVFDAVKGHKYGHIAMWSGTQWISDFKQKSIIVNTAYKNGKKSIFRWK